MKKESLAFASGSTFKSDIETLLEEELSLFEETPSDVPGFGNNDGIPDLNWVDYCILEGDVKLFSRILNHTHGHYNCLALEPALLETVKKQSKATEMIFTISLNFPTRNGQKSRMCVVEMLGSQTLSDLRDSFFCPCDFTSIGNESLTGDSKSTRVSPSHFLIENTVHQDTRGQADGMAQELADWYRKIAIPGCENAMVFKDYSIRLDELVFRMNSYYLFVHQGSCSHPFQFLSVRKALWTDVGPFPNYLHLAKILRKKCQVCKSHFATKITTRDERVPFWPFWWCGICFDLFHFKADGSLAYTQFTAFDYRATL